MRRVKIAALFLALFAAATVGAFAFGAKHKKGKEKKSQAKIEDLITKGEFQKAVELAQKFEKAGEVTEGLYIDMGVAYFNMKDYPNAVSSFEKAVEQNPFGSQALLYEATCYHQMGQPDKVAECYERVLEVDPTNNDAQFNLAQLYETQNNPAKALEGYEAIYENDPGYKDVAFALGLLHYNQGEYKAAQPYLEKAVSLKPDNDQYLLALGQNELKTNDFAKATDSLKKYLAVTKNESLKPAVLDQVAVSYEKLDNYQEALAAYDQVLALRPTSAKAVLGKGNALVQLKKYKEALPVLQHYMEISRDQTKKEEVAKVIAKVKKAIR